MVEKIGFEAFLVTIELLMTKNKGARLRWGKRLRDEKDAQENNRNKIHPGWKRIEEDCKFAKQRQELINQ